MRRGRHLREVHLAAEGADLRHDDAGGADLKARGQVGSVKSEAPNCAAVQPARSFAESIEAESVVPAGRIDDGLLQRRPAGWHPCWPER